MTEFPKYTHVDAEMPYVHRQDQEDPHDRQSFRNVSTPQGRSENRSLSLHFHSKVNKYKIIIIEISQAF